MCCAPDRTGWKTWRALRSIYLREIEAKLRALKDFPDFARVECKLPAYNLIVHLPQHKGCCLFGNTFCTVFFCWFAGISILCWSFFLINQFIGISLISVSETENFGVWSTVLSYISLESPPGWKHLCYYEHKHLSQRGICHIMKTLCSLGNYCWQTQS